MYLPESICAGAAMLDYDGSFDLFAAGVEAG
jgi:hypothetical protein